MKINVTVGSEVHEVRKLAKENTAEQLSELHEKYKKKGSRAANGFTVSSIATFFLLILPLGRFEHSAFYLIMCVLLPLSAGACYFMNNHYADRRRLLEHALELKNCESEKTTTPPCCEDRKEE